MPSPSVITRFAPSPTGALHVGSARTALFNWLYARHCSGVFTLRMEDTDRLRSSESSTQAILEGLRWMGLKWDGDIVFQSHRIQRHQEVAQSLLASGHAYRCYCSPEELEEVRRKALAKGLPPRYPGTCCYVAWRDAPHTVRLTAPRTGKTVLQDAVHGLVEIDNSTLDDRVLLRADGTPTYMLAVVVDDHDSGVTHVIRGDDHLNNAFCHINIYTCLGWPLPVFAHIPMILGADGAKLSKRHGAVSVQEYMDQGILPSALCNVLMRLGWSHGSDEIIPISQAIAWFSLEAIGRSASRFDLAKLHATNAYYIRHMSEDELCERLIQLVESTIERKVDTKELTRYKRMLASLSKRSKTLLELRDMSLFLLQDFRCDPQRLDPMTPEKQSIFNAYRAMLLQIPNWYEPELEAATRLFIQQQSVRLADIMFPVRIAITGRSVSPSLFEIFEILGREDTLQRLSWLRETGTSLNSVTLSHKN